MTPEDMEILRYFWQETGDLERWVFWEEAKADMPKELIVAWNNYKAFEKIIDLILEKETL